MATGIEAHLRDLENEARDAERDVDDFQDRAERRIEAMNEQVRELVARVQKEKQGFREQLDRKKLLAKKKHDEVAAFRVCQNCPPASSFNLVLTCSILRLLSPAIQLV